MINKELSINDSFINRNINLTSKSLPSSFKISDKIDKMPRKKLIILVMENTFPM